MNLQNRATLVSLTIRGWTGRKKDKVATEEVHQMHHANNAGHFNKNLVDRKALELIRTEESAARQFHYENTLPWGDDGMRILTVSGFEHYRLKMSQFKEQYTSAVDFFLKFYPSHIANARLNLNGLFNETEYPTEDELRERFNFKISFKPIPDQDDFRLDLDQEELDILKKDLARELEEMTHHAHRDLWLRLKDAITTAHTALNKKDGRLVKNTFQKFKALAETIDRLNFTQNPDLNSLAREAIQNLANLDLTSCKKDPEIRQQAAAAADAMLAKINQFV